MMFPLFEIYAIGTQTFQRDQSVAKKACTPTVND
jgi:hypothetical protein